MLIKLSDEETKLYSFWLAEYERKFKTNSKAAERTEAFFAVKNGKKPYWMEAMNILLEF
jgi:hypothetical protein